MPVVRVPDGIRFARSQLAAAEQSSGRPIAVPSDPWRQDHADTVVELRCRIAARLGRQPADFDDLTAAERQAVWALSAADRTDFWEPAVEAKRLAVVARQGTTWAPIRPAPTVRPAKRSAAEERIRRHASIVARAQQLRSRR